MSSTSSNKHIESSIMMRAAKSGSCSSLRCDPSSCASSPSPLVAPPADTSKRGFGERIIPNGTLPKPDKPGTKTTGPRASFS